MIDCIALDDFNDLLCRDLIEINLIKHLLLDFSDVCFGGNHVENFAFNIFIRKGGSVIFWKGFKYALYLIDR